jgi:hypothetical protein
MKRAKKIKPFKTRMVIQITSGPCGPLLYQYSDGTRKPYRYRTDSYGGGKATPQWYSHDQAQRIADELKLPLGAEHVS